VIGNLSGAGAQKIITTMANHWSMRGWGVTLIALDGDADDTYFAIDPRVRLVRLGVVGVSPTPLHGLLSNLRRIARLRRAVRTSRAEVVVSFLTTTNVRVLMACWGLGVPVLVSERADPKHQAIGSVWRALRLVTFATASRVVAQTETALGHFPAFIRRRGIVLPNPVALPDQPAPATERVVAGVGRLEPVKGFDILVAAFARCAPSHPDWRLTIWGVGSQKRRLAELANELGLGDRLRLPGRSPVPGEWVNSTGIFVLSSRHEGFPNVLLEAMAAGLPVVATDCPPGAPRAMIADGETGVLVANQDVAALAAALDRLMADAAERRRLAQAGRRRADERFALPRIMARWTALLHEAATRRGRSRRRPRRRRAAGPTQSI
jgi:glycosyltransferase involved in cell wall biosynthesis